MGRKVPHLLSFYYLTSLLINESSLHRNTSADKVCKSCLTEGVLNFKTDNIYFVLLQGPASSALTKINMQLLAY
jgi:hypothetical protein